MTIYGLTATPSGYGLQISARDVGSHDKRVAVFPDIGKSWKLLCLKRNNRTTSTQRNRWQSTLQVNCAMDASYGDARNDSSAVFPRINVRDSYKRLGISREASEDEIQAARNFLIQRYGGRKPSVDAIELAHDKIIMQKFYERKNPKIDLKEKVREVSQSRVAQAVTSRF